MGTALVQQQLLLGLHSGHAHLHLGLDVFSTLPADVNLGGEEGVYRPVV